MALGLLAWLAWGDGGDGLQALGLLAAVAAAPARAFDQRWRHDGLAQIHETVRHELTPRELARQLCNLLADHLEVPACALYEYAFVLRDEPMIQHLALKRLSGRNAPDMRFPELLSIGGPLLRPLLVQRRLLRTGDIPPPCLREIEGGDGPVSDHYLVVPFEFDNEVRGVMVFRSPEPLPPAVDELLIPGATTIGVALESAQSRDNLFASLLDSQHLANQLQENQVQLQHSQASLEEKIQHVNGIFDSMQSGLVVVDGHGCIQDCNPALLALTGLSREGLIGRPCGDLFEQDEAALESFLGNLGGRLEALAAQAPQEARNLFQTVPLACLLLDDQQRILMANPRALSLLGYVREELRHRPLLPLAAGDEPTRDALRRVLEGTAAPHGLARRYDLLHKDGQPLAFEVVRVPHRLDGQPRAMIFLRSDRDLPWTVFCPTLLHRISRDEDDVLIARLLHPQRGSVPVRVTASFNPGRGDVPEQTVINVNDVSALIHKNAQIQAQNRLLEKTMEAMQDGVLQIDREGTVLTANPKALELLALWREAVVGRPLQDLLVTGGDAAVLENWLPSRRAGLLQQLAAGDSMRLWHRLEELQHPVLVVSHRGAIDDLNDSACSMLGLSRGALRGAPLASLLASADLRRIGAMDGDGRGQALDWLRADGSAILLRTLVESLVLDGHARYILCLGMAAEELKAQAMVAHQNVECHLPQPSDAPIPVLVTAAPLRDSEGMITGAVVTLKDMREIKEKEAENLEMVKKVEHSQRLDALGQLAAGVAHDFNNLLGVIQNHAELVEMKLGPDSKAARNLSAILQATTRARDIVIKLNGLGRAQPPAEEQAEEPVGSFALAPLLEETKSLLQASLKGIDIVLEPATLRAADVQLRGDSGSLQQVLVNLCVNASHAIGERRDGRIVIDARRPAAGQVQVDVVDNGSGIAPEVLARIFEPFFTTKEVGKGTGLGLAMVRSIVTKMGGAIDCRSTPGEGATFTVTLPCNP